MLYAIGAHSPFSLKQKNHTDVMEIQCNVMEIPPLTW